MNSTVGAVWEFFPQSPAVALTKGKRMRVNLDVPYEQKDLARQLGAKWDLARKTWYVENVERLDQFLRWIPANRVNPGKGKKG